MQCARVPSKRKYPEQGDTQLACLFRLYNGSDALVILARVGTLTLLVSLSPVIEHESGCIGALHPFESDGLDEEILNLYHCQIRLGLSQAPMQRDGGRLRRA